MRKSFVMSALLLGVTCLSACDNSDKAQTANFTPEQQIRLAEIKSNERIELEKVRSQSQSAGNQNVSSYQEDYPMSSPVNGGVSNGSDSHVGSNILAAGVGAVGGYMAGKAMSKPENQQKAQEYKRKAYTQYRYNRAKVSSTYRSFKKRK